MFHVRDFLNRWDFITKLNRIHNYDELSTILLTSQPSTPLTITFDEYSKHCILITLRGFTLTNNQLHLNVNIMNKADNFIRIYNGLQSDVEVIWDSIVDADNTGLVFVPENGITIPAEGMLCEIGMIYNTECGVVVTERNDLMMVI